MSLLSPFLLSCTLIIQKMAIQSNVVLFTLIIYYYTFNPTFLREDVLAIFFFNRIIKENLLHNGRVFEKFKTRVIG